MSDSKHDRAIEAAKSAYASHYHSGGMEAAIAAYLAAMREPGEGEVRVRVCVSVDEDNQWAAAGGDDMDDGWARERAKVNLSGSMSQTHILEANVPAWRPPSEETVEGEVVG